MNASKIGVGLYALSGAYGKKDERQVEATLRYAIENGVDFVDMAESYGHAEAFAGRVLKPYKKRIRIATKVSPSDDGTMNCSYEHIIHSCKSSLQRLGMACIELYQIHYDDPNTSAEETVAALEALKKEGCIQAYGLGHLPHKKALAFMEAGSPKTLMIELHPLCIHRYSKYKNLCETHGIAFLTMGSTGRGLFTGAINDKTTFERGDIRRIDPLFHHGKRHTAHLIMGKIMKLAEQYHRTPVQVVLNWVLHKPCIHRALVGTSQVSHLKENLGGEGWHLSPDDAKDLNAFIQQANEELSSKLQEEVENLLKDDARHDDVVADMIYVLETLIESEQLDEAQGLPLFTSIMTLKTQKSSAQIRTVKGRIRAYLRP